MGILKELVKSLDASLTASLAISNVNPFGLAETVKDGDKSYPAVGDKAAVYDDNFPLTWYHRAKNGSVNTDFKSGRGRNVYVEETVNMVLVVFADRTKLVEIDPHELYTRFWSRFPNVFDNATLTALRVHSGWIKLVGFNLERNQVVNAEMPGNETPYGPEMIAIQIDYQIQMVYDPRCVPNACLAPTC